MVVRTGHIPHIPEYARIEANQLQGCGEKTYEACPAGLAKVSLKGSKSASYQSRP